MFPFEVGVIVLVGITFFAAFVNGALGYGFSSLTVPVGLLFYTNRVLNPALILIEMVINLYVLFINRASVPAVWKRIYPILIGLLPGIAAGSYFLASLHPGWLKFVTYITLLPLIFFQAAGVRRPIQSEKLVGAPFGAGLGFLYSVSTISGPPLALLFNNQGLVKQEFRAGLGLIRTAESSLTALAYYYLGLFTMESMSITWTIVPGVLIGIPLGAFVIRHIDADTFRRICMSFDAWIVGFGLSRVLMELELAHGLAAYTPLMLAITADAGLYVFFARNRTTGSSPPITGAIPVALSQVHK